MAHGGSRGELPFQFVAMNRGDFEDLLDEAAEALTAEARIQTFKTARDFETRVYETLEPLAARYGVSLDYDPDRHVFPDIGAGEMGVEVKFTEADTWRSVANSVLETIRREETAFIYVVFGKMGGVPEVRWDRYDDCVIHVRTSHVPRFEVEIGADSSLFDKIGIAYQDFSRLPMEEKMGYIRQYARERLRKGERLWWLEDRPDQGKTLPIQVRLYTDLTQEEKRRLRAEAALLCPQIVSGSRSRDKYTDVSMFLITYHGVLAPQVRDMFSAGSVAGPERGGKYIPRALQDIENEMRDAALRMEDALFEEYWGRIVPPERRIEEWLARADKLASDWVPSQVLFRDRPAEPPES